MQFVGQPPMHYLTQWRMQLAARMLGDPRMKVGTVAAALGYVGLANLDRVSIVSTTDKVMDGPDQRRAVRRISHELCERHHGAARHAHR